MLSRYQDGEDGLAVDGALPGTPLRPGDPETLGAYRMLRRLGAGGMGSVYLAQDAGGRLVAVKVIRSVLADEPEFRRRFRSEVARAREVPPFCTAEVLDADPDHDTPYLVVEYVEGPSLADVVVDRGPLSAANLHGLAIGVATALAAIHGAGIIHRDLKPQNVLLAPGSPKVIDFGIARAEAGGDGETATDQLIGTVAYMAPERLDPGMHGRKLTAAADVFAWGAVVAFAATGEVPFLADSSPATAVAILTREPDLDGVPDSLRGLVARSLAKNPKDRPTARELLDELLSAGKRPVVAAGATTVVLPPARPGPEPDRLSSGQRAAVVHVTDDRGGTRVAPASDRSDATEIVRPSGRRGRTVLVTVLVLALLATGGTLAAVLGGWLKIPGATTPEARASSPSPSISGSPSASPSAVVPAGTAPTAGYQYVVRVDNPLNQPDVRGWYDDTVTPGMAGDCAVGPDGLVAKLRNHQSWRCHGPSTVVPTNLRVVVEVQLTTPGSCAGIWTRFDQDRAVSPTTGPGGYALRICGDTWTLYDHHDSLLSRLAGGSLPTPLALGAWVPVQVEVVGSTISLWYDQQPLGQPFTDSLSVYDDGHTVLGALVNNNEPGAATFEVRFRNVKIYQMTPAG